MSLCTVFYRKFVFCLIVVVTATLAIELPCRYELGTDSWTGLYFCDLNNSLTIPDWNTQISSVTGKHVTGKSFANVEGFRVKDKTLHYLPHGLEKYFDAEKIQFMELQSTGLIEIRQSDLQPFTKMNFFSAWGNELRVLPGDLFKFNPMIRFIGLGRNKIMFIDGNVFNNLNYLDTVYLDGNICTGAWVNGKESANYKDQLVQMMKSVVKQCSPYRS